MDSAHQAAATTVLIIDDDAALVDLLTDYLKQFNYNVLSAGLPSVGLKLVQSVVPSLVLLDIMLPERNGFEVCRLLRASHPTLPIIMLTARGDVMDRIVGLELGADDYVSKPFEPRELLARMQSVLRRSREKTHATPQSILRCGRLILDLGAQRAQLGEQLIELTALEFDILAFLAQNAGSYLDRDQLSDHLKGSEWNAVDRSIDVLVSRLRQKLGDDPRHPRLIKTVRGKGYMLIAGEDAPPVSHGCWQSSKSAGI